MKREYTITEADIQLCIKCVSSTLEDEPREVVKLVLVRMLADIIGEESSHPILIEEEPDDDTALERIVMGQADA